MKQYNCINLMAIIFLQIFYLSAAHSQKKMNFAEVDSRVQEADLSNFSKQDTRKTLKLRSRSRTNLGFSAYGHESGFFLRKEDLNPNLIEDNNKPKAPVILDNKRMDVVETELWR